MSLTWVRGASELDLGVGGKDCCHQSTNSAAVVRNTEVSCDVTKLNKHEMLLING